MKIAILDDYQHAALGFADWSRITDTCRVDTIDRNVDPLTDAASLEDYDALCMIRERMAAPRALIEKLPNLKAIFITGAQHRTLDLAACSERGILVCNTDMRGAGAAGTPELAWGLLLAAARAIPAEDANMRAGGWQRTVGTVLEGKKLGLVGLGRTGQKMARYAAAFGMEVMAWSQNLTEARATAHGARRTDKATLFATCDAVSLHLVLSERSRGIVGAREIDSMKLGAILVNTARGPIVDGTALLDALQGGRIRAALDVYDEEPLAPDHPLRSAPNVVLSPHLGYVVDEGYRNFFEDTVQNIEAWLAGAPIRVVNPDVLSKKL